MSVPRHVISVQKYITIHFCSVFFSIRIHVSEIIIKKYQLKKCIFKYNTRQLWTKFCALLLYQRRKCHTRNTELATWELLYFEVRNILYTRLVYLNGIEKKSIYRYHQKVLFGIFHLHIVHNTPPQMSIV